MLSDTQAWKHFHRKYIRKEFSDIFSNEIHPYAWVRMHFLSYLFQLGKILGINMMKNAFGPTRMQAFSWKKYPKTMFGYIFDGNYFMRVGPKACLSVFISSIFPTRMRKILQINMLKNTFGPTRIERTDANERRDR